MQLFALRRYYLPAASDDTESLGTALWLEQRYWENMSIAIANGIDKAFS